MAKRTRNKRERKWSRSNFRFFPILVVLAVLILAVAYWKLPQSRKQELQGSLSNAVESVKQKVQDHVEKAESDSKPVSTDHRFNYAGLPRPTDAYPYRILLLTNSAYLAGFCEQRKAPAWVSYRVFKLDHPDSPPRPSRFLVDDRTLAKVNHDDYTRSGYDRGHMAPNYAIGSRYGAAAQRETFLMSNIVPQEPTLNRTVWRLLEERVAKEYAMNFEEVWIITGPVYDEHKESLKSGVEIPDGFFKIIVDEVSGKPRVLAFVIGQDVTGSDRFSQFLTSVDEVEKETGLDFLAELEDGLEDEIEAGKAGTVW